MEIRPANMRRTHGLQTKDGRFSLSVSSTAYAEERLSDPWMCRESGTGMDAPGDIPTGSVKAFFGNDGNNNYTRCFGFCQRTTERP